MKTDDDFDPEHYSFGHAIFLAGQAISPAKGRNLQKECLPLAKLLRSDMELGSDERELLAELLLGLWKPPVGRANKGPGHKDIKAALDEYFKNIKHKPRKQVLHSAAQKSGLTERAVEMYVREKLKRENKKRSGSTY